MGSFYACEGELMIPEGSDASCHDFIFPSPHDVVDGTVASQLTTAIHNNLPQGLGDDIKKQYSSKSMRMAGITLMVAHPLVEYMLAQGILQEATWMTTLKWLGLDFPWHQ